MPPATSPAAKSPGTVAAVESASTRTDRKSTRLNSSHSQISYAVFCLKKKKIVATVTVITNSLTGVPDARECALTVRVATRTRIKHNDSMDNRFPYDAFYRVCGIE